MTIAFLNLLRKLPASTRLFLKVIKSKPTGTIALFIRGPNVSHISHTQKKGHTKRK